MFYKSAPSWILSADSKKWYKFENDQAIVGLKLVPKFRIHCHKVLTTHHISKF